MRKKPRELRHEAVYVLRYIERNPGCTVREIAESQGNKTSSSVNKTILRLVARGVVRRVAEGSLYRMFRTGGDA